MTRVATFATQPSMDNSPHNPESARLTEEMARLERDLAGFHSAPYGTVERDHRLARAHLALGICRVRRDGPTPAGLAHFHEAAQRQEAVLQAIREGVSGAKTYHSLPLQTEWLLLCVLLNRQGEVAALAEAPDLAQSPSGSSVHALEFTVVRSLVYDRSVAAETLDALSRQATLKKHARTSAAKHWPVVAALAVRSEPAFRPGLDQALAAHVRDATRGELRHAPERWISIPLSGLIRLARNRGWDPGTPSPWVWTGRD